MKYVYGFIYLSTCFTLDSAFYHTILSHPIPLLWSIINFNPLTLQILPVLGSLTVVVRWVWVVPALPVLVWAGVVVLLPLSPDPADLLGDLAGEEVRAGFEDWRTGYWWP